MEIVIAISFILSIASMVLNILTCKQKKDKEMAKQFKAARKNTNE